MSFGEICSTSQLMLPLAKCEEAIPEDELKYQTDLMKAENNHLQTIYEDEKKHLKEVMKCEDYKEQQHFFKTEFTILNNYLENLKQDVIVIKNQYSAHGEKLALAIEYHKKVSNLLENIKEQDVKNNKFKLENKSDENVKKIRHQKQTIGNEIFQLENILIEKRNNFSECEYYEAKLKAEEDKKRKREESVKIKSKELDFLKDLVVKKKDNYEKETEKVKIEIEDLKLKIVEKKKHAKHLEEFQEIFETLQDQRKSKLDNRQRLQTEQNAELEKLEKQLLISEEKLENCEKNYEEFSKSNNLSLITLKNLEESKIQEILLEYEQNIDKKKLELEEVEKNLQDLRKSSEEKYREKQEKIEEAKNLLNQEKNKIHVDKQILEESRQKIIEGRKKIESQIQEKQTNLQLKENAILRKKELKIKIDELKSESYQEREKISLLENMKKDSLEVTQHVEDALEFRKNLIAEETELKDVTKEKLKFIENRIINETREFNDRTLALETEIQVNAKDIAKMKREVKKRDDKEMKKERALREKLTKLQEDVKKLKIQKQNKKSELKFEEMEFSQTDLSEEMKIDNLKSILKPLSMNKVEIPAESKSPRKVQFDIESDESTLSQFPLTQKRQSP